MELTRLLDWEARLARLVRERRNVPYAYGTNDCATFAQDAVFAVTGIVLLPGVERPRGFLAAARFMISRGWENVEEMTTDILGETSSDDPLRSRRGDIVSFEKGGEKHLAVRVGSEAVSPLDRGLGVIGSRHWARSWKVG